MGIAREKVLSKRKKRSIEELLFENEILRAENKAARERLAALRALQQTAQSLASELNLEPLLQNILRSAIKVMDASAGSLLLIDPATDELVLEVIKGGRGEALQGQRMAKDKGIAGWVVTNRRPPVRRSSGRSFRRSSSGDCRCPSGSGHTGGC